MHSVRAAITATSAELLVFLSTAKTGGRIFTMYGYLKRRGFVQECAFWGFRLRKIVQGNKTPKTTKSGRA